MSQRLKAALAVAVAIAVPAEGLRQVAYHDPGGVLTVCYGSTRGIDPAKTYSLAECQARLDADMLAALESVERCAPGVPENVLAAFGDAVYNLGPEIVCDPVKSRAARLLAAGDVAAACRELPRWDKARVGGVMVSLPGLTKRRAVEMEVCLGGVPSPPAPLPQAGEGRSVL
ncbi:MAG: lysozyme [Azonexus sp.]|jgi:GH24 family phage-related lysozyme (muramidase)|nr:lysozyme [Azonexus sp.]